MDKGAKILTGMVTFALIVEAPGTVNALRSLLPDALPLETVAFNIVGPPPVPGWPPVEPGMPGTGRAVDAVYASSHSGTVQVIQGTIFRAEYRKPHPFDARPIPAKGSTESSV